MQITSVRVSLRMSREVPIRSANGRTRDVWKTVEIGAEGTVEEGETFAQAKNVLYDNVREAIREAFTTTSNEPTETEK